VRRKRSLPAGAVALAAIALSFAAGPARNVAPKSAEPQRTAPANSLVVRRYIEGETLTYLMKGVNEEWRYGIQGNGVVRKDAAGTFFEEYQWSNLGSNRGDALAPAGLAFHHELSLDLGHKFVFPNLAQAPPVLIGPITDLLTFYSDATLMMRRPDLAQAGDHAYVKWGGPNSWADGTHVLVGEDSIDFDLTLTKVDRTANTATLVVRHVAPKEPVIKLPAEWMKTPIADVPNNWVEVKKSGDKYVAGIGKETFDVEMTLGLADGRILRGTLDNTVDVVHRECADKGLSQCGEPSRHTIKRKIEITLQP
jgi:hypothetical protein